MEKKAASSEMKNGRLGGKCGIFKGNCAGFSFPPEGETDHAGRKSEGKQCFKPVWHLVVLCGKQQASLSTFSNCRDGPRQGKNLSKAHS